MSKLSIIHRQKKRERCVERFADKRVALKKIIANPNSSPKEKFEAQKKLNALPRNASPVRLVNRCQLTGRPRGVYRKFGLARSMLRLYAMKGWIAGIRKSSW